MFSVFQSKKENLLQHLKKIQLSESILYKLTYLIRKMNESKGPGQIKCITDQTDPGRWEIPYLHPEKLMSNKY